MALTDEFVQMKINGENNNSLSSSSSSSTNESSSTVVDATQTATTRSGTNIMHDGSIHNNYYGNDDRGVVVSATMATRGKLTAATAAAAATTTPPMTVGKNPPRVTEYNANDNSSNRGNNNNNNNNNNILRTKFLQPFLSGRMALSTVQSLARVAGAGVGDMDSIMSNGRSDDNNNEKGTTNQDKNYSTTSTTTTTNMDGFNKGAFGIANVLSHRRGGVSSNSRTQLIQWQRESLRDARREIWDRANTLSSYSSTASASSFMPSNNSPMSSTATTVTASTSDKGGTNIELETGRRRWNVKNEDEGRKDTNINRMTPLVGILQKRTTTAQRRSRNNNNNNNNNSNKQQDETTISAALKTIENDMAILDVLASLQPQLSGTEVGLLLGAIVVSGVGPIFFPGTSVTEVLAPAAAACEWYCCVVFSLLMHDFSLKTPTTGYSIHIVTIHQYTLVFSPNLAPTCSNSFLLTYPYHCHSHTINLYVA